MTKKAIFGFFLFLFALSISSCGNMSFGLPDGPQGPTGRSAYEVWVEQVKSGEINWPKDKIDVADYLIYIKGEKGDKGDRGKSAYELWKEMIADGNTPNPHNPSEMWPSERNTEADFWDFVVGRDGNTPHIGENGNWWIGNKDTNVYAYGTIGKDGKNGASAHEMWKKEVLAGTIEWPKDKVELVDYFQYLKGKDGKDGRDGITPHIGENGNWWLGNTDTGTPAKGQDGKDGIAGTTPHIGENGNWWVGDKDTGVPAKGQNGNDGKDGISPRIGENGNWWFGNEDTGVPARGQDGKDGIDGRSPRIGENGNWWLGNVDTGIPARGQDGKDGQNGLSPRIGDNGNWWIGDTDTGVPARGKKGENGSNAKSAYELWFDDLKAGKIIDHKTGNPWPKNEDTIADFWRYLRGAKGNKGDQGDNGNDGLSAYEVWKRDVLDGKIKDPNNPSDNWPSDQVSKHDFFRYLTGPAGKSGVDAYKLWFKELKEFAGTPKALINHRTGEKWPVGNDTIDHFFEYLRGKDGNDGSDGTDGKPGETGHPGAIVKIIKGFPNVIAQYSQQDFGEYIRTEDGSVLYKVYDDNGNIAPHAKVKGLPGLPEDKTYTANANGEFVIPRKDLPWIAEVYKRWGVVKEVTIGGVTKQSAMNTYVPNQVQLKLIQNDAPDYKPVQVICNSLKFRILRQLDPGKAWEDLPNYLPKVTEIEFVARRVTDHLDPMNTIDMTTNLHPKKKCYRTAKVFEIQPSRYVIEHYSGFLNDLPHVWDGKDNYYTVMQETPYYGTKVKWQGVVLMSPWQKGPYLKSLKLRKFDEASGLFLAVEGEFDYSNLDYSQVTTWELKRGTLTGKNGETLDYVYPLKYSEEEIKKAERGYASTHFTVPGVGEQESSSKQKMSGVNQPTFFLNTVYLGSTFKSRTKDYVYQGEERIGTIKRVGTTGRTFKFVLSSGFEGKHPPVTVTYSED